jgi:sulfur relay (sulfurtransferase) complex TusBCD TusD component (DsrE family)
MWVADMAVKTEKSHPSYPNHRNKRCVLKLPFVRNGIFHPSKDPKSFLISQKNNSKKKQKQVSPCSCKIAFKRRGLVSCSGF